jgi:hypothetical protein
MRLLEKKAVPNGEYKGVWEGVDLNGLYDFNSPERGRLVGLSLTPARALDRDDLLPKVGGFVSMGPLNGVIAPGGITWSELGGVNGLPGPEPEIVLLKSKFAPEKGLFGKEVGFPMFALMAWLQPRGGMEGRGVLWSSTSPSSDP